LWDLAAKVLKGLALARIWSDCLLAVKVDAERQALIDAGWGDRLDKQYMSKDLAFGDSLVFAATGITTSPLLPGVEVRGSIATTYSVLMRARSGTVRFVEAHHNLERKTIHLRSTGVERQI
jgi:fructose-1,6-bisphosphatase II